MQSTHSKESQNSIVKSEQIPKKHKTPSSKKSKTIPTQKTVTKETFSKKAAKQSLQKSADSSALSPSNVKPSKELHKKSTAKSEQIHEIHKSTVLQKSKTALLPKDITKKMLKMRIIQAIDNEDIQAVEQSLEEGANPNAMSSPNVEPLLCSTTNSKIIIALLKHGADPDVKCYNNEIQLLPAVFRAVQNGSPDVLRQLIKSGAKLDTVNSYGQNLLDFAANDNEMVAILMEKMPEKIVEYFGGNQAYSKKLDIRSKQKEEKHTSCLVNIDGKRICAESYITFPEIIDDGTQSAAVSIIKNALQRVINTHRKNAQPDKEQSENSEYSATIKIQNITPEKFIINAVGSHFWTRVSTFDETYVFSTSTGKKISGDYLSDEDETPEREENSITDTDIDRQSSQATSYTDMNCYQLWYARNEIFANNGYCFKTSRAINAFGKRCYSPYGRISNQEEAQIDRIKSQERQKGCRNGRKSRRSSSVSTVRPTFNCNGSNTYVERKVCANSVLAQLDIDINTAYRSARNRLSSRGKRRLKRSQKQWIRSRDRCGSDACIESTYRDRIEYLNNL